MKTAKAELLPTVLSVREPGTAPLDDLVTSLADLIERIIPTLSGDGRVQLGRILDALVEPVRIAVAGKVNAGKSTVVNALVGQLVAPTDVSECTRMVTWFRYGLNQRLEVVLHDGTRREEHLGPGGQLPPTLGNVAQTDVRRLEVWLRNEALRSMTLIDTPGLGSLNTELSSATEDLLAADRVSGEVTAVADAVLFILNNDVMEEDIAAVRAYHAAGGKLGGPASIGVLSKADKLATGPDWAETVRRLTKRHAERLKVELSTVIPLVGRVAQTTESAMLTNIDAGHLEKLAEMDEASLSMLLLSVSRFTDPDVSVPVDDPVPPEARQRLLGLLDLQGIAVATALIRDGVHGAGPLRRELSKYCGIDELRTHIYETCRGQGAGLKVRSALNAIDRLCVLGAAGQNRDGLASLAADTERFRLGAPMHRLAESRALELCTSGAVTLPDDLVEDLRRMSSAASLAYRLGVDAGAAAIRSAALAGVARWKARTFAGSPGQRRVARVMERSYTLAFQEAETANG